MLSQHLALYRLYRVCRMCDVLEQCSLSGAISTCWVYLWNNSNHLCLWCDCAWNVYHLPVMFHHTGNVMQWSRKQNVIGQAIETIYTHNESEYHHLAFYVPILCFFHTFNFWILCMSLHPRNILTMHSIMYVMIISAKRRRKEEFPHRNWPIILGLQLLVSTAYFIFTPSIYQFVTTPHSVPEEQAYEEVRAECGAIIHEYNDA